MCGDQPFYLGERQQLPGRCVRVGEDDPAVVARVVVDADLELLAEWNGDAVDTVQLAIHRVEAVGDVRQQERLIVLEQRHEGMREHFVRTVADEDVARTDAEVGEMSCDGFLQAIGVRIGVEAKRVSVGTHLRVHRGNGVWRRRIWVLVGIQLDEVGQLGLFARNVGRQAVNEGAPELAHERLAGSDAAGASDGIMQPCRFEPAGGWPRPQQRSCDAPSPVSHPLS